MTNQNEVSRLLALVTVPPEELEKLAKIEALVRSNAPGMPEAETDAAIRWFAKEAVGRALRKWHLQRKNRALLDDLHRAIFELTKGHPSADDREWFIKLLKQSLIEQMPIDPALAPIPEKTRKGRGGRKPHENLPLLAWVAKTTFTVNGRDKPKAREIYRRIAAAIVSTRPLGVSPMGWSGIEKILNGAKAMMHAPEQDGLTWKCKFTVPSAPRPGHHIKNARPG